jgi:drug/metabolite transporter (DMT)-like permease
MIATVLVLALPAMAEGLLDEIIGVTGAPVGVVAFLGMSSGVGYLMWLYALKTVTASTVTTFLMLGPVTALVAGALLLDEPVTLSAVLGIAVLGVGLWVTSRDRVVLLIGK